MDSTTAAGLLSMIITTFNWSFLMLFLYFLGLVTATTILWWRHQGKFTREMMALEQSTRRQAEYLFALKTSQERLEQMLGSVERQLTTLEQQQQQTLLFQTRVSLSRSRSARAVPPGPFTPPTSSLATSPDAGTREEASTSPVSETGTLPVS